MNSEIRCTYDEGGMCSVHGMMGSKFEVSSKQWKKKGKNKGFGWVTTKVQKYRRKIKNNTLIAPNISSNLGSTASGRNSNTGRTEGLASTTTGSSDQISVTD